MCSVIFVYSYTALSMTRYVIIQTKTSIFRGSLLHFLGITAIFHIFSHLLDSCKLSDALTDYSCSITISMLWSAWVGYVPWPSVVWCNRSGSALGTAGQMSQCRMKPSAPWRCQLRCRYRRRLLECQSIAAWRHHWWRRRRFVVPCRSESLPKHSSFVASNKWSRD